MNSQDGFSYLKYNDPLGLNLYIYCNNNPVNAWDPSGHGTVWNRFGEAIGSTSGKSYTDYSGAATNTHGGGSKASQSWTGGGMDYTGYSGPTNKAPTAVSGGGRSSSGGSGGGTGGSRLEGTLQRGSSGQDVSDLQHQLVRLGYLTMPRGVSYGYFGVLTEEAVNNYKNEAELWNFGQFQGVVGQTTWDHIMSNNNYAAQVLTNSSIAGRVWPIEGGIGNNANNYPNYRSGGYHGGIDINGVPVGTPIVSSYSGTVVRSETIYSNGKIVSYGNLVVVESNIDNKSVCIYYAHMNSREVVVGEIVNAGQQIGTLGSTGRSTGPHLHFETRINGVVVDPRPYLPAP